MRFSGRSRLNVNYNIRDWLSKYDLFHNRCSHIELIGVIFGTFNIYSKILHILDRNVADVSQFFAALCGIPLMFLDCSEKWFTLFGYHTMQICWEEEVSINCLSLEWQSCLQEALDLWCPVLEWNPCAWVHMACIKISCPCLSLCGTDGI